MPPTPVVDVSVVMGNSQEGEHGGIGATGSAGVARCPPGAAGRRGGPLAWPHRPDHVSAITIARFPGWRATYCRRGNLVARCWLGTGRRRRRGDASPRAEGVDAAGSSPSVLAPAFNPPTPA